jgi:hypothetical protein
LFLFDSFLSQLVQMTLILVAGLLSIDWTQKERLN